MGYISHVAKITKISYPFIQIDEQFPDSNCLIFELKPDCDNKQNEDNYRNEFKEGSFIYIQCEDCDGYLNLDYTEYGANFTCSINEEEYNNFKQNLIEPEERDEVYCIIGTKKKSLI